MDGLRIKVNEIYYGFERRGNKLLDYRVGEEKCMKMVWTVDFKEECWKSVVMRVLK